ncbi:MULTISPECIES: hypothetical protein [Marinobacter]|uniref:hypothetical protein n=1 Tax=Marinobacter TaxID=2742 RepID=UPI000DACF93C|nr:MULTISPECIES: hypothetical protein [Marinobacter]
MTTLLIILAVLFLTLFILIPILEKYAGNDDGRDYSKLTRWIFPLLALLIVMQMVQHFFF